MATYNIDGDNTDLIRKARESRKQFEDVGASADRAGKQVQHGFREGEKSITGAGGAVKSFISSLAGVASGMITAQAAMALLRKSADFLKSFVEESKKQQAADLKTRFSIMSIGETADKVFPRIQEQIADLQRTTGQGDDSLAETFSRLNRYVEDSEKSMRLLVPVMGYAKFMGQDVAGVIDAVGKAINIGMTAYLGRYGLRIDEATFKTDRFKAVMDALSKYGDILPMSLNTIEGKTQSIANYLGDIKEGLAMPTLEEFINGLSDSESILANISKDAASLGEKLKQPAREFVAWMETAYDVLADEERWTHIGNLIKRTLSDNVGSFIAKIMDPKSILLKGEYLLNYLAKKKAWSQYEEALEKSKKYKPGTFLHKWFTAQYITAKSMANEFEAKDLSIQKQLRDREALFSGGGAVIEEPTKFDPRDRFNYYMNRMASAQSEREDAERRIASAQAQSALVRMREEGLSGIEALYSARGKKLDLYGAWNLTEMGHYGKGGSRFPYAPAVAGELVRGGAPLNEQEKSALSLAMAKFANPESFLSRGQRETLYGSAEVKSTEENTDAVRENTQAMNRLASLVDSTKFRNPQPGMWIGAPQ